MLTETGTVMAVEADAVWVETIRKTTCGTCSVQKGCGHGLMNRLLPGRQPLVRAVAGDLRPTDCKVGDEVQISIPESVILRGSLVVYILPLLCMLGGAALGASLLPANSDAGGAVGMLVGIAVGYLLVRLHAWRHRYDRLLQPTLVSLRRDIPQPLKIS